jgi:hypothetical protein
MEFMTPIGLIILPIAILVAFFWTQRLVFLVVIFAMFPGISIFNWTQGSFQFGIQSYFMSLGLILLQIMFFLARGGSFIYSKNVTMFLIVSTFCVLCASFSAFILPTFFEGLPIYSPRLGIDVQYENLTSLIWTPSNFVQAVYLILNFIFVIFILGKNSLSLEQAKTLLTLSAVIYSCLIFLQKGLDLLKISFPYDLIYNNPTYGYGFGQQIAGNLRVQAGFTEASTAAAYGAALFAFCLFEYLRGQKWYLGLTIGVFMAVILTTSSTGIALIVIIFLMLLPRGLYSLIQGRFVSKLASIYVLAIASVLLIFTIFPQFGVALSEVTVAKSQSLSFRNRLASDLVSLNIFVQTAGFGVGLGSNRPSSFFTALLSNLGWIGVIVLFGLTAFFCQWWYRWWKHPDLQGSLLAAFFVYVTTKLIALPDINDPTLWTLLGIALIVRLKYWKISSEAVETRLESQIVNA